MPQDEEPIMNLLREMHAEEAVEPVDELKVLLTLRRLLYRDGGIVGIIRSGRDIEGTIGLSLDEVWYSSSQHINKLWLFVPPKYRKTPHAKSCMEFGRWYSDQVGVPLMSGEVCTKGTEKRVELVGRQMPTLGRLFVYNARITLDLPTVVVSS
jgi:hypothetical protein